jgi:ubiquinone biosynthesis accessory factor UbiK
VGESRHLPGIEVVMAKAGLIEEIDQKMKEVLAQSPAKDLEKNLRALLASGFSRVDLVTREEFDVQREVLARTRARLHELEAKLAELEQRQKAESRGQKAE